MDKGKQACEICNKKFNGMFVKEHQCKRCNRMICKECCTRKKPIFTQSSIKLEQHRCCDFCFPVSTAMFQMTRSHNLAFLTDSEVGKQWASLAEIDEENKTNQSKGSGEYIKNIKTQQLWQNMTDTMRELFGLSLGKMTLSQVDEALQKIVNKHKLKITNEQLLLLVYIFCHCSEALGIKVYRNLIDIITSADEQKINQAMTLYSLNKNDQSNKNIISNTRMQLSGALFLDMLPTPIVNQLVMESLLAGSSTSVQFTLAWILCEYLPVFQSAASFTQVKQAIYKSADQQKLNKAIKLLRRKVLQKEKQNKLKNKQEQKKEQRKQDRSESEEQRPAVVEPMKKKKDLLVKPFDFDDGEQFIRPRMHSLLPRQPEPQPELDEVSRKIKDAAQYLHKLETGELNESEINIEQMDNLNEYLDQIIAQNDQALKQCEYFDGLLSGIQEQMYKSNKQSLGL